MNKRFLFICFSQDLIPRHDSMIRTLLAEGYDVSVVTWERSKRSQSYIEGVRYKTIRVEAPLSSVLIIFTLRKYYLALADSLGQEEFEICMFAHAMLLPLVGRLRAKKYIYDIPEFLNYSLADYFGVFRFLVRPLIELFEKYYIKKVDAVSYVGSRDDWLADYVSSAKLSAEINNFPDTTIAPQARQVAILKEVYNGKNVVIYVGGLSIERGAKLVVDVATELRQKVPNLHIILMGRYRVETSQLLADIDRRGLGEFVEVIEHVDYQLMLAYLKVSKVGLALYVVDENIEVSRKFGPYNSRKIFTYMKMGLPVLVSSGNPFSKFVSDIGCGDVVDIGSQKQLVSKIYNLFMNSHEVGKVGSHAVRDRYNWRREEAVFIQLLKKI